MLKESGCHNYLIISHQWFDYAENRTVKGAGLEGDVAEMHNAGTHTK